MMHQNVSSTRKIDAPDVCVLTTDGEPDALAFYDSDPGRKTWLTMRDPVDLRDWR
jgi:hypothetical protein